MTALYRPRPPLGPTGPDRPRPAPTGLDRAAGARPRGAYWFARPAERVSRWGRREVDMTQTPSPSHDPATMADAVVARILARAGTAVDGPGRWDDDADGEQLDRADRAALRRVAGLSTELSDVSEVEYRQLRLERVVLA